MSSAPVHFDAAVIGAGPAGAVAARLLAQAGWRVALIEKSEFPRRKVCGEFLSATSLPVLEACGIADAYLAAAGPEVTRVALYAGQSMIVSRHAHAHAHALAWGRALGRDVLDTMLRDAAVAAGAVPFQPVEVTAHRREGARHALVLEDGREVQAGTVIAACGSWNAKGPFAVPRGEAPSDLFAFKGLFRGGALPEGHMPLLAFPGGYGGLVHSNDGGLSLSCCIRRDVLAVVRARHGGKAAEAVIAHIRATTRGAEDALRGAIPDGALLAVGPIRPGIRAGLEDGCYRTGNLAGEAHPVIAEGISMAIQGAGLLARLLIEGRGDDYPLLWRRKFAARIRAAGLFAHLAMHGGGRAAMRPLIAACPGILDFGARLSGKL